LTSISVVGQYAGAVMKFSLITKTMVSKFSPLDSPVSRLL